jgi:hypothetical protein
MLTGGKQELLGGSRSCWAGSRSGREVGVGGKQELLGRSTSARKEAGRAIGQETQGRFTQDASIRSKYEDLTRKTQSHFSRPFHKVGMFNTG